MNMDCLFCKIVNGDIPAEIVKNTERVTAFKDISPQAPVHILVIPNSHFDNMAEVSKNDAKLAGEIFALADEIAKGNSALNKARAAIDRVLGRIAAPNIPTEIIPAP